MAIVCGECGGDLALHNDAGTYAVCMDCGEDYIIWFTE